MEPPSHPNSRNLWWTPCHLGPSCPPTGFPNSGCFTLIEHPQTNKQAKSTNKVVLKGLRRRLEEAKGRWTKELPQVLWSYHTIPHSTTQEISFRLTLGADVVIPIEIGASSPRTTFFQPTQNEEAIRTNLTPRSLGGGTYQGVHS
ncbi:hypothetical protein CR513_18338, partial [Mucuna pruriens]